MNATTETHWTDDADLLERFVLNKVGEPERSALGDHLSRCERCRQAVRQERELAAGVRLLGREKLLQRLRERLRASEPNLVRRYQIVSLAAAVTLMAIGFSVLSLYYGSFDWPTKFSSKEYVVNQRVPDSSKELAEGVPQRKPAAETGAESAPSAVSREELAARSVSGPGVRSETAAGGAHAVEGESRPPTTEGAFWLLGTITVIHESSKETADLAAEEKRESARRRAITQREAGQVNRFTIRKGHLTQTIILSQRPTTALPESRLPKMRERTEHSVETLIERQPDGLSITMYLDRVAAGADVSSARVEAVTEDSLILTVGNERIAYRIPGGWGSAPSGRMNIDRR